MLAGQKRARSPSPLQPCLTSRAHQVLGAATSVDDRLYGHVRWYNGRRQIGIIRGDNGREIFIPVGGAATRNFVPLTPSGLMHWTRVSYKPVLLEDMDVLSGVSLAEACSDVQHCGDPLKPGLDCGVETRLGGRLRNEDRLIAHDVFDLGFLAGVFDGHGGENCVDFVSQRFPVALHASYGNRAQQVPSGLKSLTPDQEEELIVAAIRDAFELTDDEYLKIACEDKQRDGSTALVVLLAHGFEAPATESSVLGCRGGLAKLFVANCGDCRAILLRGRKAVRLSEDHKPERTDETARIQQAGGIVIVDGNNIHRVGRKRGAERLFLSTSRSFGDLELKTPRKLVIAEPEVVVHTLDPGDWALVIACDGVWNTMTDQGVADAVWHTLACKGLDTVEAAKEVANRAEATGSTDNVTVFVMRFGWAEVPAKT